MICVDCSTDYIDGPMASIFSPETILALGSAEGIDSYTCSQCVGVYYERC